jgi:hypothetical protein
MTISSTSRATSLYTGNGATLSFAFTFKVQDSDDVAVYRLEDDAESLVADSEYTVSLNANQNTNPGGSVVFSTAPTSLQQLRITTTADATQELDIQNQGAFNPAVVMEALDKLTIQAQQLGERINRSLLMPITDVLTGGLPAKAARKGKALGFHATTGAPEMLDYVSSGIVYGAGWASALTLEFAELFGLVNVLHPDYGVAGDGTDETTGIHAALDDAVSTGRMAVFPPGKTYSFQPYHSTTGALRVWIMKGATTLLPAAATPLSIGGVSYYVQFSLAYDGSVVICDGVMDGNRANLMTKAAWLTAALAGSTYRHYAVHAYGSSGDRTATNYLVLRGQNWINGAIWGSYLTQSIVGILDMHNSGGAGMVINSTHTDVSEVTCRTIDHDQWYISPHLFDMHNNEHCRFGPVSVSDHAGNGTTGAQTTASAWVSGVTASCNQHCQLHLGHMFWRDDVALQKSLALSIIGNTDFHMYDGNLDGYTDTSLEYGSNQDSTVNDLDIDGWYRKSTLDTSYTSWGVQITGTNFAPSFLGREIRGNTNIKFNNVNVRGFNSFGWYIVTGRNVELNNCTGEACFYGAYIAQPSSAHVSFPKAATQNVDGLVFNGGSFSRNESDGIIHLYGDNVRISPQTKLMNNNQGANQPGGRRRDATAISGGAGYGSSTGGNKNGFVADSVDAWDDQSTTGSYVSYDPSASQYIHVANPQLWRQGMTIKIIAAGIDANLAIGSTTTNVAHDAFTYYIKGTQYSKTANAVGVAPGNDVVPINTYGAVAFEIGTDGTIDAIEATANSTGYASAALAAAGLPPVQVDHVRLGYVTAMRSTGSFTFGTTALNAASTTVAYTDTVDLITMIDETVQDRCKLRNDLQRFPLVAGTGTISTSSTTITGSGTDLDDEAPFRAFIRASSQDKQLAATTTNTAGVLETAFSSNLSGATFQIYRTTADQIRSQAYGLRLGADLLSPVVKTPNFSTVGNVTRDIQNSTAAATTLRYNPTVITLTANTQTSHTGSTTETALKTFTIPARAMGPTGYIDVDVTWSYTNSANNKTKRVRINGIAGTAMRAVVSTTTATYRDSVQIANRNSASSQIGSSSDSGNIAFDKSGVAIPTASINTDSAFDLVLSGQLASAGESIAVERATVRVVHGP